MEEKKEEKAFKPKAYTFFIMPFYYDGEWEEIHKNISRWQPQQQLHPTPEGYRPSHGHHPGVLTNSLEVG